MYYFLYKTLIIFRNLSKSSIYFSNSTRGIIACAFLLEIYVINLLLLSSPIFLFLNQ